MIAEEKRVHYHILNVQELSAKRQGSTNISILLGRKQISDLSVLVSEYVVPDLLGST
jgi:hypothetical protein